MCYVLKSADKADFNIVITYTEYVEKK